jgi:hypothetical protein
MLVWADSPSPDCFRPCLSTQSEHYDAESTVDYYYKITIYYCIVTHLWKSPSRISFTYKNSVFSLIVLTLKTAFTVSGLFAEYLNTTGTPWWSVHIRAVWAPTPKCVSGCNVTQLWEFSRSFFVQQVWFMIDLHFKTRMNLNFHTDRLLASFNNAGYQFVATPCKDHKFCTWSDIFSMKDVISTPPRKRYFPPGQKEYF